MTQPIYCRWISLIARCLFLSQATHSGPRPENPQGRGKACGYRLVIYSLLLAFCPLLISCGFEWSNPCDQNGTSYNLAVCRGCTDECASGAKQCSGTGYQVCGNTDADPCLEWGTVTACGTLETCSNGNCVALTIPAAPSSLQAAATSASQINLSWTDNSNNEDGFKVERKTGAGGTYSEIKTVGAGVASYSDTGLTCATTYYYRVRANNGAGDSGYSNEANVATSNCPLTAPTAPSGLTATVFSYSKINIYWVDNSNNEDGFKIERKTGAGGTYSLIKTTSANATSYSDTGLPSSTTYYYRAYAYNSAGNSSNSNEVSATTQVVACSGNEYIDMGTYYIAKYEASHPDATLISAGSDSSKACSLAGVLPWVNVDWNGASSACTAAGGRLCGADEWGDACDGVKGSGGSTYPYGNTYQGSTCNGYDAGKGGAVPTGSMTGCISSFGAYDMSGNVWEWTNEASGSNRVIRGGSFDGVNGYLECSARDYVDPTSSNYSVGYGPFGFRCCQDK